MPRSLRLSQTPYTPEPAQLLVSLSLSLPAKGCGLPRPPPKKRKEEGRSFIPHPSTPAAARSADHSPARPAGCTSSTATPSARCLYRCQTRGRPGRRTRSRSAGSGRRAGATERWLLYKNAGRPERRLREERRPTTAAWGPRRSRKRRKRVRPLPPPRPSGPARRGVKRSPLAGAGWGGPAETTARPRPRTPGRRGESRAAF